MARFAARTGCAHFPKPFFVAARRVWRVQIAGKQVNLGPDRDDAFREYHRLMAAPRTEAGSFAPATVAGVADAFLGWCHAHRFARTYAGHKYHLERFVKTLPDPAGFPAADLRPGHVESWFAAHPGWPDVPPERGREREAGVRLGGRRGARPGVAGRAPEAIAAGPA